MSQNFGNRTYTEYLLSNSDCKRKNLSVPLLLFIENYAFTNWRDHKSSTHRLVKNVFKKNLSYKRCINLLIQLAKNNFELSKKSKVFSVGPWLESYFYKLLGLGFKWRKINTVDTYSYSPRIRLGNMPNLVFKNKTSDLF